MSIFWLDLIRLMPLVAVIGYAAYKDYKFGSVSNRVWFYAPVGFVLTVISCFLSPDLAVYTLLSILATVGIGLVLFYVGGWGGADAKAFMTIALCLPVTPFIKFNVIFMYPLNVILISSLLAFVVGKLKHTKTVRFMPYILVGMLTALVI